MKHLTIIAIAALSAHPSYAATNSVVQAEKCGVVTKDANGKSELTLIPDLNVIELTNEADAFKLPSSIAGNVQAIQCGRTSIIPATNDYKVVKAGFPLGIVANERVGILELVNGRLIFRMISGEMSEIEVTMTTEYLNGNQSKFNTSNSEANAT